MHRNSKANFEEKLRAQYLKRDPKNNPLGGGMTEGGEEKAVRPWKELGLGEKVRLPLRFNVGHRQRVSIDACVESWTGRSSTRPL
jgi:hypothetical protein